ncbi:diphthamide biosynthesis enzyme Dph2 [Candidatus Hecatella orcuttiae]|jgi:2-(3-amino-3-carboxypropyl)histidine synthase|uniref:diphthamide biosynthesis enzyme Dph2 n=1 Tax=Candidatus Hecatella orcuttiae TaxID=1935119 RepID=UPI002867BAE6|nr:diphthamide biosynthesis enzyme Dph2 [Candidatus Hecatella orcuttiae]
MLVAMSFRITAEEAVKIILQKGAQRVLLQLPDGLKPHGFKLAEEITRRTGALVYVSADPCYGACDTAWEEAERLKIDLLIHYGHSPMPTEGGVETVYLAVEGEADLEALVEKALPLVEGYRKLGLTAAVQHVQALGRLKEILAARGIGAEIGPAAGRVAYGGQILGCDYTTAQKIRSAVDAFLYLGGGLFHPLGIFISTGKPVVVLDPYLDRVMEVSKMGAKLMKQRQAAVAKLLEAEKLGILVGLKPGQRNVPQAEALKEKLEKLGKKAVLLCVREVTPEVLDNFPDVEAFVNTACPRIGFDDGFRFRKPLVTPEEVSKLLRNHGEA